MGYISVADIVGLSSFV